MYAAYSFVEQIGAASKGDEIEPGWYFFWWAALGTAGVGALLSFLGAVLLGTRDERFERIDPAASEQATLRRSAVGTAVSPLLLIGTVLGVLRVGSSNVLWLIPVVALAWVIAYSVRVWATARVIGHLAHRAGDDCVSRRADQLSLALPLTHAFGALFLGLGPVVAAWLLDRLLRQMQRTLADSVRRAEAFGASSEEAARGVTPREPAEAE